MGITVHGNIPAALREVTPAEMGINAVAGNATTTGNWINCTGYNQVSLATYYLADAGSSAQELTFYIDVSNDGAAALGMLQTSSVDAGVATLSTLVFSKDTNNDTVGYVVDFPINYKYFRVVVLPMASGDAADDITIRAYLGKV